MTKEKNFSGSYSLTDEIAATIRERILKGEYKIGEKIKETQIAGELKVSRTPIREAFKILEDEGLIEYKKNRGCYARGFTRQDIDDIYAVRKVLEVLAVEWACIRMTPDYLDQLKDQCDLMEFYTNREDYKHVLALNKDFHDIIYSATGSRFMTQVLHSYKSYIEQARQVVFMDKAYLERILAEHRQILKALEEGSVEDAKSAMAIHLDHSKERASAAYKVNE
jgi:DNA-binding GntR family transcriptional regulator